MNMLEISESEGREYKSGSILPSKNGGAVEPC